MQCTAYQCTTIKVIVQLQHTKVCTIQSSVHAWCISALLAYFPSQWFVPTRKFTLIITTTISCDMWNRIHNFLWGYITCTCYHRNKGEVCTLISNTEVCSSSICDQKSFLALSYHDDVVSNNVSSQNWTTGMNFMFVLVSLMPRTPPRSRKKKGLLSQALIFYLIAVVLKPCKWRITNLSA